MPKHKINICILLIFISSSIAVYLILTTDYLRTTYKVIYVNAGNIGDPFENGQREHPFDKIEEAIVTASNGDMIIVSSGIYCENLKIDKSISLIGESRNSTTIIGKAIGATIVVVFDAPNILFTGFTVKNGLSGGILIQSENVTIRDNIIDACGLWAIMVSGSKNTIEQNIIRNIYSSPSSSGDRSGGGIIVYEGSHGNIIVHNVISESLGYSILDLSRRNLIAFNNQTDS